MKLKMNQMGLAALAALLLTSAASAQTPPAKIGIINIQGAILATKDGEKARTEMQAKFAGKAKDMESRTAEINRKKDQFNKGANTMAADAREKLAREIDDLQKKYQWDSEDLNNDMQQEQGKLVNAIGQQMVQVIDGYAKNAGFAIVLDVSGEQSPVIWAANGIDITQEIVKLYDEKYAAGSGPSSTAAPVATKPIVAPPAAAPKKPAGAK